MALKQVANLFFQMAMECNATKYFSIKIIMKYLLVLLGFNIFFTNEAFCQENDLIDIEREIGKIVDREITNEVDTKVWVTRILEDWDLYDNIDKTQFIINEQGQYQIQDSSLVTDSLYIWLTSFDHNVLVNKILTLGYIKGLVIKGHKEGAWIKYRSFKYTGLFPIKKMNYVNGQLNGDYYVYTFNGDTIKYNKELDATSTFNNGTGLYLDYYYETGKLKVKGNLKDGKRQGKWCFYSMQGEIIKEEVYINGFSINQ